MKTQQFIDQLDPRQIEAAIQQAERETSGEIRVYIHPGPVDDPVAFAQGEFLRLAMTKTRLRNAVLLFVAPASQNFALVGDEGVHAKCGDAFWREVAASMQTSFSAGRFTAAILEGVARTGQLLAEHFPHRTDDVNELPDAVVGRPPVI